MDEDALFEVPPIPSASNTQESDSSSSESEPEPPPSKKGRPQGSKSFKYECWKNFPTKEAFDAWWSAEKLNWTYHSMADSKTQLVHIWFCKHNEKYGGRVGYNCGVRLRICYPQDSPSVFVERLLRQMHSFEEFIQDVDKVLSYWSQHVKEPPKLPTIPLKEMKKGMKLEEECKPTDDGTPAKRLYLRLTGTRKYVFAASDSGIKSLDELYEAYQKIFVQGPSNWSEYSEGRFKVYVVEPAVNLDFLFYECSCPRGAKKEVCKHATFVMCSLEKTFEYSAEATAAPMENNRRKKSGTGRPPLAPRQNRHAVAD